MSQKVNVVASVGVVTLTPLARIMRTVMQVLVAVAAAVPILLNTPAVSGNAVLAKYVGVVGGLFVTVVTVMNLLENYGIIPVIGGKPATAIVPAIKAADLPPSPPQNVPSL